ncbi:MAG: DUF4838 domain-containing protein [Bacteroidetes bacterium]|nr:DUF4838 domain-containing protein [Bacteroidota bacterium]
MIKKLFISVLFLLGIQYVFSQDLSLVSKGKSDYRIVLPVSATSNENIAAKLLQQYIKKISQCELPIVYDREKSKKTEILIGLTNRTRDDIIKTKQKSLKQDGYYLYVSGEKLLILGGSGRGIIYGVTGLLEDYLHCRKYTPWYEFVPVTENISLPQLDDTQIPPAEIRIVHGEFTKDTAYEYFRKIVETKDIWNDGDFHGYYVHTLPRIIPADIYFASHSEYFALINGQRVPYGQYCLSNPEVLKVVIADLKDQMAKHPSLKYWSVSQSDNYYQCECEKCKAIDKEEGSASGLMVRFVNEVAKAFPDKIITTLAYQYTRKPPLITKPLDNVMITLCTIELPRNKPIESDSSGSGFVQEMKDWSKICSKIMLWDYETQFTNSFGPFPLYNTLQPNIQFFTKNHVIAHFQQCNARHSENFGEMKSYLLSKLLWNPNADVNAIINDFMKGFYGDAAPFIRQYFDLLHSECKNYNVNLDIYGSPVFFADNILSADNMKIYNELFDKAEKAVLSDTAVYDRVRSARMPILFSAIEIAKTDLFGPRGWYNEVNGKYVQKPEMNQILEDFYSLCKKNKIESLNEKKLSPELFYNNTLRTIDVKVEGNLAFRKKVNCDPAPDKKYTGIGPQTLTNGVRGNEDYKIKWLGWEDMDAAIVIDFDSVSKLNEISISTLHLPDVWILHPVSVSCLISIDGIHYSLVEEQKSDPNLKYTTEIKEFTFNLNNKKLRFVKFVLNATKTLPAWHAYRGSKSWIFVDEITAK